MELGQQYIKETIGLVLERYPVLSNILELKKKINFLLVTNLKRGRKSYDVCFYSIKLQEYNLITIKIGILNIKIIGKIILV